MICSVKKVIHALILPLTEVAREHDLDTEVFQLLFDRLKPKAANMNYWKKEKNTKKNQIQDKTSDRLAHLFSAYAAINVEAPTLKRGPKLKLCLEQELLLTMM